MKKIYSWCLLLISLGSIFVGSTAAQTVGATDQSTQNFCTYVSVPIAYGSQGESVRHLQNLLLQQYQYAISPTGYFGPVTYRYIKQIQRAMGIVYPTGSLGPVTLNKLRTVWCNSGSNTNVIDNKPVISLYPQNSVGNSVTLAWNVQNASSCTLNGVAVNNLSGSQISNVYAEITYTMSCVGYSGQTEQKTILIKPNTNYGLQPAVSLYANPNTFINGQTVSIIWTSTNATNCTLNGQQVALSGTQQVVVGSQPSYNLVCTGNGYTASQSLTLSSSGSTDTTYVGQLNVNSSYYNIGNTISINWTSPRGYTSQVQGVILDLIKDGAVVGTITRVNGNSGSVSGNYNLLIPKSIRDSRNDAIQCQTINGEVLCGNLITSGTYKVRATWFTPSNACFGFCPQISGQQVLGTLESQSFTINGSADANTTSPKISWFTANNTNITSGQSVVLNWSSSNSTSCSLSGGGTVQNLSTSGNITFYPSTTTTYNLICSNAYGLSAAMSLVVNVNTSQNQGNYSVVVSPTQTSYYRGGQMMISVTITNNTNTTQTYPSGSSSCPSDVSLKINGTDFYAFTNQQNRICTADMGYVTITPGQSYVRSFAGYVPNSIGQGSYALSATLNTTTGTYTSNSSVLVIY